MPRLAKIARWASVKSISAGSASVMGAESAGCRAIQPSLPEIDPAPDQVTSPLASSSSSIAGE
ncbi:Uncharacterised protein [Mycobacterium tuberculosis]|uniref:Uncharacterized protein n=1 Tax=Mycobacterium tuberculosis TaxID=1773 RepID=A0A0T9ZMZ7_MYCTX|nr:Uncharacterised protein [Mycobacterium tuberculosis]CFE30217.1 Uncharacterised protein [Mycobacterium tuberculosis]CFR42006.1 Uncharacterised protein [Mycobacterium tuberculosis]CFR52066.1 Uncharacterised protein [Mycobacterium tuberculosis]CFR94309.1 Uncharacterised protein [Mycobacterium tuberculosis]